MTPTCVRGATREPSENAGKIYEQTSLRGAQVCERQDVRRTEWGCAIIKCQNERIQALAPVESNFSAQRRSRKKGLGLQLAADPLSQVQLHCHQSVSLLLSAI